MTKAYLIGSTCSVFSLQVLVNPYQDANNRIRRRTIDYIL